MTTTSLLLQDSWQRHQLRMNAFFKPVLDASFNVFADAMVITLSSSTKRGS